MSEVQNTVSVDCPLFPIRNTRESQGWALAWEIASLEEEYERASELGGIFDLSDWGVVSVNGPDAQDFLQRLSTCAFRNYPPGIVKHGAFLTGKAGIISTGMFTTSPRGWDFVVPPRLAAPTAAHLENLHFAENLSIADASNDSVILGIWNPPEGLRAEFSFGHRELEPMQLHTVIWGTSRFDLWRDDICQQLYWIKGQRANALRILRDLHDHGLGLLGRALFEYFRLAHGIPQVGAEVQAGTLALEAGMDYTISRNKGCYPGQEVVERIFTYGQVNRKILPVEIAAPIGSRRASPDQLFVGDKEVGKVVALSRVPHQGHLQYGLAYVQRGYWDRTDEFSMEDQWTARIRTLTQGANG